MRCSFAFSTMCIPPRSRVVVCVDVSQSFQGAVANVVEAVCRDLANADDDVLDSFVCFAGSATTKEGMRALVSTGGAGVGTVLEEIAARLPTDETLLEPLVEALQQLASARRVSRVVIVSDGAFSDCAADAITTMQSRLSVPVSLRSGTPSSAR